MEFTIAELLEGYKKGKYSPKEITNSYLKRIKEIDGVLHSYITITEDRALKQADKCEMKGTNKEIQNLFGIPISFKDAIDISGVPTTNGSKIDIKNIAASNADVVNTLEASGCITLGKNNMSEYAADVTSKNKQFGDVINPIDKKRTAGGSSSGSAVSVASNLCVGSIGTDTSGSVRIPAACCGVVGIKPTFGLIGMKGVMPLSWTLDHIGVITKNINDAKYLTETLAGTKYRTYGYKEKLSGVTIGLPNVYFNDFNNKITESMMEQVINNMEKLGAQIKKVDVSFLNNSVQLSRTIGTSEIMVVHKEKYNLNKQEYNEGLVETFKRGNNILAFEYLNALKTREEWRLQMDKLLKEVDVIITPTMPILPPYIEEKQVFNGIEYESIEDYMVRYTSPFNLTGHPALSMPSGIKEDGIPLSLQMITSYYRENLLFKVGEIYERLSD